MVEVNMNNALISPNEKVYSYEGVLLGVRVAEVAQVPFEVALPLYWVDCADEVNADDWYFNQSTNQCELKPVPPPVDVPNVPPENILNVTETVS